MKKIKLAGVLLLTAVLMAGCGNQNDSSTSGQNEEDSTTTAADNNASASDNTDSSEDTANKTQAQDEDETSDESEQISENDSKDVDNEEDDTDEEGQREVSIYYIDEESGEPTSENIMITDENDIWAALQEKGVLTDDCELLGFDVNEEEKTVSINFNSALGDRIRSFGTTGETEIIGCLVNTYLDAYNCDGAKLLEEGKTFETSSGANFDGITGRIEF